MQYFATCSRCRKIVSSNNLSYVPDSDTRVDQNQAERLVGECPYKGCEGICYQLSESDNKDMNEGITLARDNSQKFNRRFFIEGVVMGMQTEHRSLQQAYGRLIVKSIMEFAKQKENGTDLRNEAFVNFCVKCLPIADSDDGSLPLY